MADVFTPEIRLNQQEVGAKEDLWAPPVSAGLNDGVTALIEQAVAERADISVTAGNILLTEVDGGTDTSRPAILRVTGSAGVARDITVPDVGGGLPSQKFYVLYNAADAAVSLRTVTNTGVSVGTGQILLLMVDEILDNVFSISLGGSAVIEAANWQTALANVTGASPAQQITYRYSSQGGWAMMLVPAFGPFNVVTSPGLDPPTTWPSEIVADGIMELDGGFILSSVDGRLPMRFFIPPSSSAIRNFNRWDGIGFSTPFSLTLETPINAVYPTKQF